MTSIVCLPLMLGSISKLYLLLLSSPSSFPLPFPAELFKPEYLGPHLHGIIAYFNIVLMRLKLDAFENIEKGKQVSLNMWHFFGFVIQDSFVLIKAIGSLAELMKLMGQKYISNVKMKIIAVLRWCSSLYV